MGKEGMGNVIEVQSRIVVCTTRAFLNHRPIVVKEEQAHLGQHPLASVLLFFFVYHVEASVRANTQNHITRQETGGAGEGSTK